MNQTRVDHNMFSMDGNIINFNTTKVVNMIKRMYGDRLVYPVLDFTPPMVPELYDVIFSIDGERLSLTYECGDYILFAHSDTGNRFVTEIEDAYYKTMTNKC